jgi:hypothetical protein
MGKVVTGKGMDDFALHGTVENIKSDPKPKRGRTPPLEVVNPAPVVDPGPAKTPETPPPAPVEEETGLEPEDNDLAERAQKRISRKHREMKQAEALAKRLQEELGDSETFSKSQYSRAVAAEEEAARLRAELGEIRAKSTPVEPGLVKPDAKDPKYYDEKGQFKAFEYAEDLSGYSATKAVEEDRKRQNEERTKAQQAEQVKAFEARLEKTREKYPDFKEVVGAVDMIVPPYVQQFMVRSPFGGDLGYWFAKNQDEAKRIFALDPIDAVAELGEITVQWKKPATTNNVVPILPKTGAPAPIIPLQSQASAQTNTDPAKMDYKSLRAYERERARNKGR